MPSNTTSNTTSTKYLQVLRRLGEQLSGGGRSLDALDKASAKDIGDAFTKLWANSHPSTWNVRIAALQWYEEQLKSSGKRVTPLLPEGFEFKKKPKRQARPVPEPEVKRLLSEVTDLQDKVLFEILSGSGLRAGEAASLTFKCLQEHDMLRVIGKGNKERTTFLTHFSADALEDWVVRGQHLCAPNVSQADRKVLFAEYIRDNPDKGIFLTTRGTEVKDLDAPSNWVYERVTKYTDNSPHEFRHFWVSNLLNNGAEITTVQQAAGHESIATTLGYLAILPRTIIGLRSKHSREQGRL